MPPHVLVATTDGLVGLESGESPTFRGRHVNALASGPVARWAIVEGTELWRKTTSAWKQIASLDEHRATCVLPLEEGAIVGTSGAHLVTLDVTGLNLIASFEHVEGRHDWYTPWGGPPDVRSLSASQTATFANVHVGGILRSDDAGQSWLQTIDIHDDVHQVLAADGVVVAATARGLAVSADDGRSWELDASGLHATYCRAVAVCDDVVLLSASAGPHGGRAALYRRGVDGSGLERCTRGLPDWFSDNIDTYCLAGAGHIAAFGTADGRVFTSSDAGETWEQAAAGFARTEAILIDRDGG